MKKLIIFILILSSFFLTGCRKNKSTLNQSSHDNSSITSNIKNSSNILKGVEFKDATFTYDG